MKGFKEAQNSSDGIGLSIVSRVKGWMKEDVNLDRTSKGVATIEPREVDPQEKELCPIVIEGMRFDISVSRTTPLNL